MLVGGLKMTSKDND